MKPSRRDALYTSRFRIVRSLMRWLDIIDPRLWEQNRKKVQIVYSLCVEDIETVALEVLLRPLTREEQQQVIDKLPRYVHWFEAIELVIYDLELTK
jgi:hypothetical protein